MKKQNIKIQFIRILFITPVLILIISLGFNQYMDKKIVEAATKISIKVTIKVPVKIKISFNPNSGTVNKSSKYVWSNKTYGDLPTPKRENYKFLAQSFFGG